MTYTNTELMHANTLVLRKFLTSESTREIISSLYEKHFSIAEFGSFPEVFWSSDKRPLYNLAILDLDLHFANEHNKYDCEDMEEYNAHRIARSNDMFYLMKSSLEAACSRHRYFPVLNKSKVLEKMLEKDLKIAIVEIYTTYGSDRILELSYDTYSHRLVIVNQRQSFSYYFIERRCIMYSLRINEGPTAFVNVVERDEIFDFDVVEAEKEIYQGTLPDMHPFTGKQWWNAAINLINRHLHSKNTLLNSQVYLLQDSRQSISKFEDVQTY